MYTNNKHNKPILCATCLSDIYPGDTYYLSPKTSYCLDCRAKQLHNRTKDPVYGVELPTTGSKVWQKQLLRAIKHKQFKVIVNPKIADKTEAEITAELFNVELKKSNDERMLSKAKIFLAGLVSKGLL